MSRLFIGLAWTVVVALATPASAAELRLEMSNGLVTLVATDTPIRQILAEWTRVGGTRIVNGERVAGPPVTLQLDRMPEQQALAVLLRSVAGYLAAARRQCRRVSVRERHDPGDQLATHFAGSTHRRARTRQWRGETDRESG